MVRYFLGHFYEPAAPVDPQVAERVLSLPRAAELRDLEPLSLEGARERFGARISEEELLLRLTMPAEQVDAMVAARADPAAAPPAGPGRDPLVRLLGELAKRDVALVRAGREGRRPGRVAPCGLTTSAASSSTSTGRWCTAAPTSGRGRCPAPLQVLEAIRASGRPLVLFTNGSHIGPEAFAAGTARGRAAGSGRRAAHAGLQRLDVPGAPAPGQPALVFGSEATRARMAAAGVPLLDTEAARVVFVSHVEDVLARPHGDGGARACRTGRSC